LHSVKQLLDNRHQYDRRSQIFLSSTYDDLKEERLEVIKALLELDCIPCGMEYFPAASEFCRLTGRPIPPLAFSKTQGTFLPLLGGEGRGEDGRFIPVW
jgi:hypothetical protein